MVLDANRSFKHLHGGTTHAGNEFLPTLRDFHLEVARAAHFRALKNGQRVAGRQFSVAHQIRTQRTGSGARRGVFIEFPGQHAAGEGLAIAAEGEAVSHGGVLALEFSEFDHVHGNFGEHGAIAQRHHQVEDPRGYKLRFEFWVEIFRRNSQSGGELLLIDIRRLEDRFFLSHGDALRAAVLKTDFHRQDARSGLLQNVHAAFLRGDNAQLREQEPGSNHGMAGEFELFLCREDAQPRERFFFRRLLHKDRLRKIHFAGDGEHLVVRESIAVGKYGEGVAFEAVVGENIERVKAVFHGWRQLAAGADCRFQMRSSWATVLSLVMFPVFNVDFGSIRMMWTSSSAAGQCSTPRGTTTNSPSLTMASWLRNFIRSVPFTTRKSSSSFS